MRPTGLSMATKGVLCPVAVDITFGGGGGPGGAYTRDNDSKRRPKVTVTNMRISDERVKITDHNIRVTGVKIIVD